MYVATERETSDNTEATRFSQCAHDQRRRLEAEDCNSIRCAQLISGGRRRIRPCPPHCLAHARPTMCCIRLVIIYHDIRCAECDKISILPSIYTACSARQNKLRAGDSSSLPSPLSDLCAIARLSKHPQKDCESDSDFEDVSKLKAGSAAFVAVLRRTWMPARDPSR